MKSMKKVVALATCAVALAAGAIDVDWKWDDSGRSVAEPTVVDESTTQGIIAWLSVWQILTGLSVDTSAPGLFLVVQ
ncbi:MAG: hypothetical protein KBT68_08055 [bacterium]|nr:hypothetical protein [Candidatus Colisoma equi]